jgi:predicted transglutaminase-like cysteine proteinase
MKILLVFIITTFLLYSESLVTNSLIAKVEKEYGRFAKARFEALQKKLISLKDASTEEKLKEVNIFFNRVGYGEDNEIYAKSDYWATPYEFLARDKGDCEDYVIAKYFALKELGIPANKMYFTYVRVEGYESAHMVLTYFETKQSMPLVLDNLNKRLLPAAQRSDLKPVFNFNPNILNGDKDTNAHRQWDDLMKRFKEKKL